MSNRGAAGSSSRLARPARPVRLATEWERGMLRRSHACGLGVPFARRRQAVGARGPRDGVSGITRATGLARLDGRAHSGGPGDRDLPARGLTLLEVVVAAALSLTLLLGALSLLQGLRRSYLKSELA